MGESAMTPEIVIVDMEAEANYIEVWNNRAQHTSRPNAL
jgi:hypothetical protein